MTDSVPTTSGSRPQRRKPRRRWLQFGLRTMLLLVTVFCVFMGTLGHRANEQRKAVQWITEHGGWVSYDYESNGQDEFVGEEGPFDESSPENLDPFNEIIEPPGPKWARELLGVDFFAEVAEANLLLGGGVTDLRPLSALKQLRSFSIAAAPIRDLSPLRGMKNLGFLDVNVPVIPVYPRVDGGNLIDDLSPLAGLTKLTSLGVRGRFRDLSPLSNLTNLVSLTLRSREARDASPLANLTHLQHLDLSRTRVNDIRPLIRLTNLRRLSLNDTSIKDLRPILHFVHLEVLEIGDAPVSDLAPLRSMKKLKKLVIGRDQMRNVSLFKDMPALNSLRVSTENLPKDALDKVIDAIPDLQDALPECEVDWCSPSSDDHIPGLWSGIPVVG